MNAPRTTTPPTAPGPPAPAWAWVLGTWFGSGLSPWIPGTAGTLASLPLAWVLARACPTWGMAWNPGCLAGAVLLFAPAVAAATRVERALGRHDPGAVVVDETLGTLLTLAFLPASALDHWPAYAAAFLLFRVLDVLKPGFIGRSQALPEGLGIVMDDVLAGLVGGLVLAAWGWWRWA